MKTTWYFYLIVIAFAILLSIAHIKTDMAYHLHTLAVVLSIAYFSRNMLNILHISILLISVTVIELALYTLIVTLSPQYNLPYYFTNGVIFTLHLFVDISLFLIFKNRVRLSILFVGKYQPKMREYVYMTHADILLVGIFLLFIVVDGLAFLENLIRNMDYIFGVSEEVAKPFWNWNWVHRSYLYIKSFLLACMLTVILATVYVERFRPAPINESEEDLTPKKSEPQHKS
ncbi:hypothetical protein EAG18_18195 [Pseudoalteromonas sp. J010]|nr:hypothetical protein EAG18_18195 [Pseudoalteromonas sp. J010]